MGHPLCLRHVVATASIKAINPTVFLMPRIATRMLVSIPVAQLTPARHAVLVVEHCAPLLDVVGSEVADDREASPVLARDDEAGVLQAEILQ